ncbi:hypothetical protein [Crystallibacter degradans]|uniref:hypothetical protein n=1 Tax=Crystallibacter degradans TaxID=2726743 RepID=UPI00147470AC|nr:hypothetical protein [Arthrobacter sp. SF27]NMR29164.1 hypothetical protein [Arthrobacter sp. SF27]
MFSKRQTQGWHATGDALVLADRHPSDPAPSSRLPGVMIAICIFVVLLGGGVAIYSGYLMAIGAPETSSPGSRGNMPRPVAFVLGIGLALSSVLIVRQERQSLGKFHASMTLTPDHVVVHNIRDRFMVPWSGLQEAGLERTGRKQRLNLRLDGPASSYRTVHAGTSLSTCVLENVSCADAGRDAVVLQHYLSKADQRHRIGTDESARHANSV